MSKWNDILFSYGQGQASSGGRRRHQRGSRNNNMHGPLAQSNAIKHSATCLAAPPLCLVPV